MRGPSSAEGYWHQRVPKLDWKPNESNTLTAEYNRVRWDSPYGVQTGSVVARSIDSNGNDFVKDDRLVANWNYLINSWASNNMRFVYSRDFEFEFPTASLSTEPLAPQTGFSPQVDITSCGFNSSASSLPCSWTLGTPYYLNRADYPDEKRYQGADTFSITAGTHLLKFGVDITSVNDLLNAYASGDQYGEYSYSQLQDFISDYVVFANHLSNPACQSNTTSPVATYSVPCYNDYFQTAGPLAFTVPTLETGLFIQDDWHVLPRITLNMGLRWDHEGLPSPVLPNTTIPQTTTFPSDNTDFGPRIGFAIDLTGQGKIVFRGGYGVYYGRITNEQIYEAMTQTGNPGAQLSPTIFPTTGTSNDLGTPTTNEPIYPNILSPASISSSGTINIAYFPSDLHLPAAEEYNLVLENEIARNTAVSISWIGSVGRFLPIGINTDLPKPTTLNYTVVNGPLNGQVIAEPFFSGAKLFPGFNSVIMYCSCGTSHYNGLVFQLNRRMTSGLQVNMSYTAASDTDDLAGGSSGGEATSPAITSNGPVNPYNLRAENGTSNLEVKNRFVGTLVWQPPYFDHSSNLAERGLLSGWVLSFNQTAQTGLPFTQTISGNEPSGTGATISSGGPTGGSTSIRFIGVPKNVNFLPPTINTDMRLGRTFSVKERVSAEFTFEVFNLANHPNYTGVTGTAYSTGGTSTAPTLTYSTGFGGLTAASNGVYLTQRQMQFGAKISF